MIFDQEYTKLCSEKTLQAAKEGFFLQFVEGIVQNVGEKWIKDIFGRVKTDKERIRKIYEDEKIREYVVEFLANVQEIYRKKCHQTAKKRLAEAEIALKHEEKKKALNLFTQSILKAPKTDETLSVALLGRAKILMSFTEFSNALTDLQLSLKEKMTNRQRFDAFLLMSNCYKALNEDNKAQVAFNVARQLVEEDKELLEILRQFKHESIANYVKKTVPTAESHVSKKLAVKKSKEMGRYIVSNDEIKVGETLVVEEPAVACLLPEKFGTHCHHCFNRFLAPIGCPDCSSVAFCGPKCRDAAISSYHMYECKFLDLLIGSGMSVLSLTALRAITQKKLEDLLQNKEEQMYSLCTNADKRVPRDFLQRSLMAAFLLRCLQKSGYFGTNISVVPANKTEYKIGEMLLHYLQILQFNAHEICEFFYGSEHKLKAGKPTYIGVGVYPTVALFNHDCYPAVARYFIGKKIVIKSLRPLGTDSTISENYGPIFTYRKLIDRQRSLSARYWFNCRCNSCLEDWPLLNNASSFIKRVRCPTINCGCLIALPIVPIHETQCTKCKVSLTENIEKLKWCEQQYEVGSKLIDNKEVEKAIKVLCEALEIFHRVAVPPHRETHLAEEALKVCFSGCGNTYDCSIQMKTK